MRATRPRTGTDDPRGQAAQRLGWVLAGTGLYGLAQFVLVVILARSADPVLLGSYGLAQAVTAPVLILSHCELRRMLATDVGRRYDLGEYLALQLATGTVGLALCVAIGTGCLGEQLGLVVSVGLKRVLELMGELLLGGYQRADRLELLATSMTMRALGEVCLVPALFVASGSLTLAVVAGSGASLAVSVAHDIPRLRGLGERLTVPSPGWRLLALAREGMPAGLTATLGSLTGNVPRYLIEVYRGRALLGFFVSLYQLLQAGTMVNSAIAHAELAGLARTLRQSRSRFRSRLRRVCTLQAGVQLAALAVMLAAGGPLLAAVYRPEYAPCAPVAVVLFAGATLRAVAGALSAGHMVLRSLRAEAAAAVVTGLVTTLLGWLWIPRWGLMGAALAILAAALLHVGASAWIVRRRLAT